VESLFFFLFFFLFFYLLFFTLFYLPARGWQFTPWFKLR
jgi:hypothetical protein